MENTVLRADKPAAKVSQTYSSTQIKRQPLHVQPMEEPRYRKAVVREDKCRKRIANNQENNNGEPKPFIEVEDAKGVRRTG